jgi:hypothetical protein
MELSNRMKIHTLVTRELQEYRMSLLMTPLVVGGVFLILMLGSVLFANRIAFLGSGMMNVLSGDSDSGFVLEINIDEEGDTHIVKEELSGDGGLQTDNPDAPLQELVIVDVPDEVADDSWNFSQEWTFSPPRRHNPDHDHDGESITVDSLNPMLNGLNSLFLLIMFFVSVNYLLGALYADRKDRSILFWKSMPVSEWQEVLCKLGVASIVVPVVYLAVSLVTQLFVSFLAMLMVWRMGGSASDLVLSNIQFVPLLLNQLSASLIWALFTVPVYAWLLLASATAKRSPFLLAAAIPIGLVFIEKVLIGSNHVLMAIGTHLPRHVDGSDAASLGFYKYGPVWSGLDYIGMLLGFAFAALALVGAVWLRRHRFET